MSYSLSSEPGKVVVIVQARFDALLFAFVPVWTVGWLVLLLDGIRAAEHQSMLVGVFFGLITLVFAYQWLWNPRGEEQLEFTPTVLTYKRSLLGLSSRRVFSIRKIDRPRFVNSERRGRSVIPSGIGFSYEGKQLRFGDHLGHRDAKEIIANVLQRLPDLRPYWGSYEEGFAEVHEDLSLKLR